MASEFNLGPPFTGLPKIGPPTNPATRLREKFLSLMWYNLFVGVNEMCVKNITVTVSVRVSVTVMVSLV